MFTDRDTDAPLGQRTKGGVGGVPDSTLVRQNTIVTMGHRFPTELQEGCGKK